MSGLHLKKMLCQATNSWRGFLVRHFGLSNQWLMATCFIPRKSIAWTKKGPHAIALNSYCTAKEDQTTPQITKKKEHPNARKVIGHVGNRIPYHTIQVLNYEGENLGKFHKKDVLQMMEKQNLKLISVTDNADPPVYKLLTGKQLSEEQLKLREKQKLSPTSGVTYTKELSFLASISQHDLDVKMKQIIQWIEKKRHVKITVLNGRGDTGPEKEVVLQQMIEKMQNHATCLAQPKERRDGRAMVCTLRPWSDKELQKRKKDPDVKKQNDLTTQEKTENQGTKPQDS